MAKGTESAQGRLFEPNLLYYGDNLQVLRRYVPDETVDLVYLDPPFKKGVDYNILFKEKGGTKPAAQIKAFKDTWHWDQAAWESYQETVRNGPPAVSEAMQAFRRLVGQSDMLAYLSMMAPRLVELHRVLKPTGSIYLHCDPTASHYLKVLMDAVFGPKNLQGEIVWRRTSSHVATRRWPRLHDVILHFAKDIGRVKFHPPTVAPDPGWVEREYRFEDERGRYMLDNLTGAGVTNGPSGQPWRGIDPAKIGKGRHWRFAPQVLDRLDAEGRIYWPKRGRYPKLKQYLDDSGGKAVGDLWTDIGVFGRTSKERLGYPTQKPMALLERIVSASTDEGDLVLDPFCGCGTTVAVAQALGRRWVGIDIAKVAIDIIEDRLLRDYGEAVRSTYEVRPEPASVEDAYALAEQDKHAFQEWVLRRIGAQGGIHKKGADKGIDGRIYYVDPIDGEAKLIVVSVKGGRTGVAHVRDLRGVMEREKAAIGVLLTRRQPTRAMQAEAAEAGAFYFGDRMIQRVQILTVADLFSGKAVEFPSGLIVPEVSPIRERSGMALLRETDP